MKAEQRSALERIYRRQTPSDRIVSVELAHFLASISFAVNRQVGVLIDRRGHVEEVIIGDAERLTLPDLGRNRAGRGRLRGLRLVHTHIQGERLSRDDLTDLSLLQLDLVAVLQIGREGSETGRATTIEFASIEPPGPADTQWTIEGPQRFGQDPLAFDIYIEELERRLSAGRVGVDAGDGTLAVAVHVITNAPDEPPIEQARAELNELARTAGVSLIETVIQKRKQIDPRYVIGRGKLEELMLATMQHGADLIVFDRDLTPGQARSIGAFTEIKVVDRTQLILDIFAQRATTRDGKLQVELAQLKYTLPRLAGSSTAMSRLMGGIGGRGPGETKLELNRRRAKDRIHHLQKQIDILSTQRKQRRRRRRTSQVPTVAIVGYTNAGKSTLLNALTGSDVLSEDKLFATLDPTTRRLRLPMEREIILTDTVGFIRDLPDDLVAAFKATLEELSEADLLLHIVDIASAGWEDRISAVNRILGALDVKQTPTLLVFNKADRVEDQTLLETLCRTEDAIAISALKRETLPALTSKMMDRLRTVHGGHQTERAPWEALMDEWNAQEERDSEAE